MDDAERKKMIADLERKLKIGMKDRLMISQMIAVCQSSPGSKPIVKAGIDESKISQDQKDYIYLKMGWL
jgi:hypothetical protein